MPRGVFDFPGKRESLDLEYSSKQGAGEEVSTRGRKHAHVFLPTLTFILEDVLGVGQHTGEGATEKQPQACGPHKQEDDIVGEDKQHQEGHHHSHLPQQRQRQLEKAQGSGHLGGRNAPAGASLLALGERCSPCATMWSHQYLHGS